MTRHQTTSRATDLILAPETSARFAVNATVTGTTKSMPGAEVSSHAAGFGGFAAVNGEARHPTAHGVGESIAFEVSNEPWFLCVSFLRAAGPAWYPSCRRPVPPFLGGARPLADVTPEDK